MINNIINEINNKTQAVLEASNTSNVVQEQWLQLNRPITHLIQFLQWGNYRTHE